jgi:hypothetical protein
VSSLATALAKNKTLKALHLSKNAISDIGALAESLKSNTGLDTLHLGNNALESVESLGNALKENSSLVHLYLGRNRIKDVRILGRGLRHNQTLQKLYLDRNAIEDVFALGVALQTNVGLKVVHLDKNPIRAPRDTWHDLSAFRNASTQASFQFVCQMRRNRKDTRALAVAMTRPPKGRAPHPQNGIASLGYSLVKQVSEYLWHAKTTKADIERQAKKWFWHPSQVSAIDTNLGDFSVVPPNALVSNDHSLQAPVAMPLHTANPDCYERMLGWLVKELWELKGEEVPEDEIARVPIAYLPIDYGF